MTDVEVAHLLEQLAIDVEHLPGVSRLNPHAFGEAKSDLAHKMRLQAKELRTVPVAPRPLPMLRPGSITVPTGPAGLARRSVRVEVRGRRRA